MTIDTYFFNSRLTPDKKYRQKKKIMIQLYLKDKGTSDQSCSPHTHTFNFLQKQTLKQKPGKPTFKTISK